MHAMLRRILLTVVLVVVGLALVNGAAIHQATVYQVPSGWVPDILTRADSYVGTEGAIAGGILGIGLILLAILPLRSRVLVNVAILLGVAYVAVQVDRYYTGHNDAIPRIVFWAAATALLMAFYPVRLGGVRPARTRTALTPPAPAPPGPFPPSQGSAPSSR
jgi:hypothetical protein